ncbi:hypothetical protein LMG27952_07708 [Paraburkholderia hiiakae]|uniref:Transmembrane protein n=1 Tax=Paraburkholderia hiiakae TaxID=1081782 RepID=A0ABM8PBQ3_9BURK|nr:hypothetical protein [Paraburkholderia hiiakae]CAD6562183.1 hypothetical protein LMG27952_07708 [Paraburkholderia hiiakae]
MVARHGSYPRDAPRDTEESATGDEESNRRIETLKALNTLALELFKALNILNAGAAAGMLAGLDKLQGAIDSCHIRRSILLFVIGLVCGLGAMLFGWIVLYVRLHLMDDTNPDHDPKKHKRTMLVSVAFAATGLFFFCYGALNAAMNLHEPKATCQKQ